MKLKYYLRGLGIGIIVTTIILAISFSGREEEISDEEVIARAAQLGMVMQEETETSVQEDTQAQDEENGTQPADALGQDAQETQQDNAADGTDGTPADASGGNADASDVSDASGEGGNADASDPADVSGEDGNTDASDAAGEDGNTDAADAAGQDGNMDAAGGNNAADASGAFRLTIQKGDVCRVVCEKLAEGGVITDSEALRKYLFEIGYASNMSIGQYDIPYGSTNEEIAAILQAGPVE